MVEALWYRPSDWLEGLRLLWGRFEGKGAVGGMGPFPVADSKETTPPCVGRGAFPVLRETSVTSAKRYDFKKLKCYNECIEEESHGKSVQTAGFG